MRRSVGRVFGDRCRHLASVPRLGAKDDLQQGHVRLKKGQRVNEGSALGL